MRLGDLVDAPLAPEAADVEITDDDRAAVLRLFKFIKDQADRDGFQVLVVDHVDEPDGWFQQAVVEKWRGGPKLVPEDWPDAGSPNG